MRVIELLNPIKSMKVDEGTYPYLEISDIDVASKKYSFKDKTSVSGAVYAYLNNILVSTVRPTRGAITVVNDEKIAVSNAFAILNVNDKICLPKYLFYSLNSKVFLDYLGKNSKGATYPTCSKEDVYNYDIKYVEYTKQIDIVTVLNNVSRQIEIKREQLLEYDQLIKSRFVEMFGLPGKDNKGWGLKPLGECCELNPKKAHDKRLVSGLDVSFVPMQAVSENGHINSSEVRSYDEVRTGFTYFTENDVLFAKITPCMENGKGAVAVGLCNNIGFGSTEFHVLRPVFDITDSHWLYTLTSFKEFRIDAANNMTGSAGQRRVPATFLDKYKVSLPPIELQQQFASFVKQIDKLKFEVQKSLSETQMLFDALMQEYFG